MTFWNRKQCSITGRDILKQENDALKQDVRSFFWKKTSVPGHLILPLSWNKGTPGQEKFFSRDKGTLGQEFFFVLGQRDVPWKPYNILDLRVIARPWSSSGGSFRNSTFRFCNSKWSNLLESPCSGSLWVFKWGLLVGSKFFMECGVRSCVSSIFRRCTPILNWSE